MLLRESKLIYLVLQLLDKLDNKFILEISPSYHGKLKNIFILGISTSYHGKRENNLILGISPSYHGNVINLPPYLILVTTEIQ